MNIKYRDIAITGIMVAAGLMFEVVITLEAMYVIGGSLIALAIAKYFIGEK